jgi:hypothetical protein
VESARAGKSGEVVKNLDEVEEVSGFLGELSGCCYPLQATSQAQLDHIFGGLVRRVVGAVLAKGALEVAPIVQVERQPSNAGGDSLEVQPCGGPTGSTLRVVRAVGAFVADGVEAA